MATIKDLPADLIGHWKSLSWTIVTSGGGAFINKKPSMLLMMAAGPYMKGGTAASADDEDCVDGFALSPRQRGLCGMTSCHYVADLVRKGMNKVWSYYNS